MGWWIVNNGTAKTTKIAPVKIYFDGQIIHENQVWNSANNGIAVNGTANCCICVAIGAGTSTPLSVGTHTITVSVDSGTDIGTYNTLQKTITIQ